jgi:uncharacterized membrane protein YhhN
MTMWAAVALCVAAGIALLDWWSVATERRRVEYFAKPGVMVALLAAAFALQPADDAVRSLLIVGLIFGLAGDVLLMLDKFIPGAAAFLLGHVAYVWMFLLVPLEGANLAAGAVLFLITLATIGWRIVAAAARKSTILGAIVGLYLVALGGVLILGIGTAVVAAMLGVVLFSLSDALLAWGRFVGPTPGGRTLVHITYHLAQALLVLSVLQLG